MIKRFIVILLVTAVFGAGFVSSTYAYTNPNHFVDSQWNLQDAAGYSSLEVDITPQVEESTSTDGYYFANTVYFRSYTGTNFGGAYAGMQSNGYDGTHYIGKMAIFSVWDVSNGIAESGGSGTSFGGEGTGYSVRLPYAWQTGVSYRLKIYIDQDAASGDRLWAASLTNLTSGGVTRIGRIYVPVARGKIYGPVTFHERYMGGTNCGDFKKSQVRFSNMTANNGALKATSWSHYAKSQVPECPGLVWLQDDAGGFVSGVATTKPVVATTTAPTPVTVPKTTPTVTPVKPITPAIVEPVTEPVITKEPDIVKPVATATTAAKQPHQEKKASSLLIILGVSITIIALGAGALFVRVHLHKKRLLKYLNKHFPFDPDI